MTKKTYLLMLALAMLSLLSTGCFVVEQEIFLEADGSGDMVMHLSLPDIPEALLKNSPAGNTGQPDPKQMIEELKQKFSAGLPPTVTLKEAKEVKRNGAYGFYIVLHFNQLSDLETALDQYSKEGFADKETGAKKKDDSYWKIAMEKKGNLTTVTQRMFIDFAGAMGEGFLGGDKAKASEPAIADEPAPTPKPAPKPAAKRTGKQTTRAAKPVAPAQKPKEDEFQPPPMAPDMMKGLLEGDAMQMMFSSLFKFRFIVHAPNNFTETNADIVLNGKTAIWNASLGAFIGEPDSKEKKELQMKVVY